MELTAVIAGIQYVLLHYPAVVRIMVFSDSQYVISLPDRATQLIAQQFITKKGNELQNMDLVQAFLQLLTSIDVVFVKIKAHQKRNESVNYNIEADKLSRKLVRSKVAGL